MDYKDYYKVMGVARDASRDEIKRAYRRLARKYHPDVSKEADAEKKFKAVAEAYEVLKDPEKRKAYDELGSQWQSGQAGQPGAQSGQGFRPPPGWEDARQGFRGGFGGDETGGFSDFFESLFGRQGRARGRSAHGGAGWQTHGEDVHAQIRIPLEDAFEGGTRTLTLQMPVANEAGEVTLRNRRLNVRIPKGIRAGQQIRLAGQGGTGAGSGEAGDLYLEVSFEPHPLYRVEGGDLEFRLPLAPWEAALGASVEVPTPSGKVALKIPAGSRAGRRLRVKGRGLPGKSAGDLYVTLEITAPPATTDEQRALYERMAKEFSVNPRAEMGA